MTTNDDDDDDDKQQELKKIATGFRNILNMAECE
jgi:hypothetical protein